MAVTPVDLTEQEKNLLGRIEFEPLNIRGGVDAVNAVCAAAKALAESLLARGAIPAHRLRFFADPDYNIGGHGMSRKERFERNARGKDIMTHVDFLRYLRYFIYGPALPDKAIEAFQAKVASCGMVTSGDIVPLGDLAKTLMRTQSLQSDKAAEEFYKLALECGLQEGEARSIRDRVHRAR